MELNKSQIILKMYDSLIRNYGIKINDYINKYNISLRTFQRYIAEINAFLFNEFKNQVVNYDHENKIYYLEDINKSNRF